MATTKPPREALHSGICFLLQARRHTHIHQYIEALIHKFTHRLGFFYCSASFFMSFCLEIFILSVCHSFILPVCLFCQSFLLFFLMLYVLPFSLSLLPSYLQLKTSTIIRCLNMKTDSGLHNKCKSIITNPIYVIKLRHQISVIKLVHKTKMCAGQIFKDFYC